MRTGILLAAGVVALTGISGCSNPEDTQRIDELQRQVQQLETRAAQSEMEKEELRSQLATVEGGIQTQSASVGRGGAAALPPNAEPGHCYARVLVPAEYEMTTRQVEVQPAQTKLETVPAEYRWVEKRVLVREPTERVEVAPATYKTVTERVMVEPEKEEIVVVPAKYDTVTEQILVRPATTAWKKGRGPIERIDEATGEIMCLVEVPAEYRTVTKRVLVEPETTRTVTRPARYETITKRVVDQPPTTRTVQVPGEYRTVRVREVVRPASTRSITVPARYETVTERETTQPEELAWREILCETNTTPGVVRRLQVALRDRGYNPGSIDGVWGPETRAATTAYQKDAGIPSGQLTLRTLQMLGVSPGTSA